MAPYFTSTVGREIVEVLVGILCELLHKGQELVGGLQQQTASHMRLAVYSLRRKELNGFEASREVH